MQFLKELPNGERVRVDEETYNVDKYLDGFLPLVQEKKLTIYSLNGRRTSPSGRLAAMVGGSTSIRPVRGAAAKPPTLEQTSTHAWSLTMKVKDGDTYIFNVDPREGMIVRDEYGHLYTLANPTRVEWCLRDPEGREFSVYPKELYRVDRVHDNRLFHSKPVLRDDEIAIGDNGASVTFSLDEDTRKVSMAIQGQLDGHDMHKLANICRKVADYLVWDKV